MNIKLIIIFLFLLCSPLSAADYYVDFDSGSDSNAGTGTGTAWKHAPGDPNATGVSAAASFSAGDVVLFRGGVVYRGDMFVDDEATTGSPITYRGNGWGAENAIIDGTDVFSTTWTQCTGPGDCMGNPDWADIWYTDAPIGFDIFQIVFEDDEFMWFAQDPNPSEPIFYDRRQDFRDLPLGSTTITATRTSITDPRYFTQSDSSYWDESYALVWTSGNNVPLVDVTAFNPATDTITIDDIGGDLWGDRDNAYAMVGHVFLVDIPGEIALNDSKIFIWPHGSDDPAGHTYTISERQIAMRFTGGSHTIIEGFDIRGYSGNAWGDGVAALSTDDTTNNITIQDNDISQLRSMAGTSCIYISNGYTFRVNDNYIHHCQQNRGSTFIIDDVFFDGNTVEYVMTGVLFLECSNSRIADNVFQNIGGTHANGLSVYSNSYNILVARNEISLGGTNLPMTFEQSHELYVIGNLIDGQDESYASACWSGMTGTNWFLQNTIVRALEDFSMILYNDTWILRDNIIDGLDDDVTDRTHNLYVGLSWEQEEGWSPSTGEVVNEADVTFVDLAGADFHLVADSPAIGMGVDVSSLYPTAIFPDYDFTVDLDGVTRTSSGGWDVGAYEYDDSPTPPTPSGNLVMILRGD